jgi:ankyrin repeat protein
MINKRFQNHCFLNYAVVYWGDHVRNSNEDAAVTTLALKLLRSKQHTEAATQARWSADNSWHAKKSVNSLHLAASFGLTRIVHILLKDGADINCLDALNMTPLIYASERGHTDTVDALLKAGAYPDRSCKRGITALQGAVRQGHKDTVTRLLAENTFSLDAMDDSEYNYTALMIASAKDLHDIAHIILERPDVDPNVRESQSGQTALMVAAGL